jgi:hypothetical protein
MPLRFATAFTKKAALAQGGFFAFANPIFYDLSTTSHTIHATASRTVQAR